MNIFDTPLSNVDIFLLGLAGTACAWLVVHYLAIERERRSAFRGAASKFRTSVLDALADLYPIPDGWPKEGYRTDSTLRALFPQLQSAVAEFRFHLPSESRRRAFDRAWSVYRIGPEGREIDGQNYLSQYLAFAKPGESPADVKAIFKANVLSLLSFAEDRKN